MIQPTHDAEELERMLTMLLRAGEKAGRTKALDLTANQGGIPHPDFYMNNMLKLTVKKILAHEQTIKEQAAIEARINENQRHIDGFLDAAIAIRSTILIEALRPLLDKRIAELKQQKESL